MKKELKNDFAVLPILMLLVISAPMNLAAAVINIESNGYQTIRNALDHDALAKRHENLAREMQAQIKEHEAMLMKEAQFNFLGNNKPHIQTSKMVRIRGCKQAIKNNLAKAAYHREIAEKQGMWFH
jgi:hypothetical protein